MNIFPPNTLPLSMVIDVMRAPSFATPFSRSSHSSRYTGMSNSFT